MSGPYDPNSVYQAPTLGTALRYLRRQREESLRSMAPQLNMSYAELSRIERDLKAGDLATARRCEQVFAAELRREHATGYLEQLADHGRAASAPRDRAPRHLPPPPAVLVGRDNELANLSAALRQGGLILVDGLAGVGKSAVVLSAAHTTSRRYRDGILLADAGGSAADDVAQRVLGQWLVILGKSVEELPDSVEERSAELGRLVTGQHLLLVLDNVVSAEQVRPFLSTTGSGCTLVVTSPHRLSELKLRAGAHHVTIRPLAEASSVHLLRSLVPRLAQEPQQQLERIAALCQGIPLALRIVAEHLNHYAELSVEHLDHALAQEETRLDVLSDVSDPAMSFRSVLYRTYANLPPAQRWLFRLLGLHGGPVVTVQGAAALTGQDNSTVYAGLQDLAAAYLLEPIQPGRWRWHDLVRLLAAERVRSEEDPYQRIQAVRRWVSWYLRLATHALSATGRDRDQAHEALDAEAVNLPAVTAAAVDHNPGLVRQLMSLLEDLGRSDLAQRCEPSPSASRRPTTTWLRTT